jgi:murein L,D-transpeptidase YafK
VAYPPTRILLAAFKVERRLELYAADSTGQLRFITAYPVLGESGVLGPKLLEGDRQVPEGSYVIDSLNPNSLFHLSLHVSYPSAFDREMAQNDGRTRLGGDIMIHGGSSSIGCLAVGDQAIEDLFVLSATVGLGHVSVLISPVDFRKQQLPQDTSIPSWSELLYEPLRTAVQGLPTAFRSDSHR